MPDWMLLLIALFLAGAVVLLWRPILFLCLAFLWTFIMLLRGIVRAVFGDGK